MTYQVEVQQAKNGENTFLINNFYIHSKYNPSREAQQIADNQYEPHYVHIIFGYGQGHLVRALLERRRFNELIVVIDPLFDDELIARPYSEPEQNVYYLKANVLKDLEQYLSHLDKQTRLTFKVLNLANYDKLFPDLYTLLLKKVKDLQNRNLVNDYTVMKFAKQWYQNFHENIFHLQYDYSAAVLQKKYTAPAVVVSGGPSLSKQINLLKTYRKQLIVVCAGSTINSLLAENIEPDYIVSIDGGEANMVHFGGLNIANSKLVYTMQNYPDVRDSFEQKGFVLQSKGYLTLSKFLEQELHLNIPTFLGGASVAHTAFNFANYITTGPVALIGQDLAYTDDYTHAKTVKHAKQIDAEFIERRKAFQIVGYDGKPVWTDPVFNSMRLEFEDLVKMEPPQNAFYNCTEGGATIEGFPQMPFAQFCQQFTTEGQVDHSFELEQNVQFDAKASLLKEVQSYKKLLQFVGEALLILKKNYTKKMFDKASLKQLDKIDEQIQTIVQQLTIDMLITPITMRVMNNYLPKEQETVIEQFERSYNQMHDLYQSIKDSVVEATDIITNIIEKRYHT